MKKDLFKMILRRRFGKSEVNAELVQVLGISPNTASARLNGKQPFRSDELEKLRLAYRLTDEELVNIFVKEGD
jgi:transcriptional regulator with XRE-family HTH domain